MIREGKLEGWLRLPIESLPSWATLNDVQFNGVTVGPQSGLEDRGSTVVARERIEASDEAVSPLMVVPRELILSLERIREHAKYDSDFREVLDCLQDFGRTSRGAILTFLLMQCSTACPKMPEKRGVTSAFTDYIKYLPEEMLPTFWTDDERAMLTGTTLRPAVSAKHNALYREFEEFRTLTSKIKWCAECWWDDVDGLMTFDDWLQVDAMYRSRALEFPGFGDCMAPCIDMANHLSGNGTMAIYEVDRHGNAILMLRDGKVVEKGEEVSITYGDAKGACEMIFSYGFLEESMDSANELFLDLSIPKDDPLGKAKATISDAPPGYKIYKSGDGIAWSGDFVWLICVNEEDGLDFAIQQTIDGELELVSLWKNEEIKGLGRFKELLEQDPMWDIFHLRAVSVLQDRIAAQLQTLYAFEDEFNEASHGDEGFVRDRPWRLAQKLRSLEGSLMEEAYSHFEDLKIALAQKESVRRYLGDADQSRDDDEEDFS